MGDSSEKQPQTSYWKGLKSEYKKITWPDKKSALKQSLVVTVISVILGLIIAAIDMLVQFGVRELIGLSFPIG